MSMDLTSAIVHFKSAEVTSQVQYAVAAKMLKMANAQDRAVLQLLEAAAQSMEAAATDVADAATDLTRGVDVYA
jgi:hypothetical protein